MIDMAAWGRWELKSPAKAGYPEEGRLLIRKLGLPICSEHRVETLVSPIPSLVDRWNTHGDTLRKMWQGGEWEGTKRPLSWLLEKFGPVPDWHDPAVYKAEDKRIDVPSATMKPGATLVYYSDNNPDSYILDACKRSVMECMEQYGFPIITVTQKPIDFGKNIVLT